MTQEEEYYFQTKIVQRKFTEPGKGPRAGTLYLPDTDAEEIRVQTPKEFGGPHSANGKCLYITPQHLLVASVASCIQSTFVSIAENSNLEYREVIVTAKGKMEPLPDNSGKWMSEIECLLTFKISDENQRKKAESVAKMAEKNCMIANSIKSEIKYSYNVVFESERIANLRNK